MYAISDGVSKALPFLVFPVIAYYLTTAEFGLISNFNVMVGFMGPFVGLSTNSALSVNFYKIDLNKKVSYYANLVYLNLALFLFCTIVLVSFHSTITNFSGYRLEWQFLALLCVFFIPITSLYTTKLQLEEKARLFGYFQIFTSLINVFFVYLFVVVLRQSWQGRIFGIVLSSVIPGLVATYFTIIFFKFPLPKLDLHIIKSTFKFGLPLLPHNFSYWLKSGFEKLFITSAVGLSANGFLSFAQTISAVFFIISNSFFGAFSPYLFKNLAEIEKNDNQERKIDLVKKSYIFLMIFFIILIAGYFFSVILIKNYFIKFEESLNYLPFFLGFNFFNAVYAIFSGYIFYTKSTKFLGIVTLSTALIQVLLTILFVKYFSTLGAVLANFITSILTAVLVIIYSNKKFKMPWLYFIKNEKKFILF